MGGWGVGVGVDADLLRLHYPAHIHAWFHESSTRMFVLEMLMRPKLVRLAAAQGAGLGVVVGGVGGVTTGTKGVNERDRGKELYEEYYMDGPNPNPTPFLDWTTNALLSKTDLSAIKAYYKSLLRVTEHESL